MKMDITKRKELKAWKMIAESVSIVLIAILFYVLVCQMLIIGG